MKEFKDILKELRNKKGISQEALGLEVNVSRSAIAKYENGLGLPSQDVIKALCIYFEVNEDYLFPKENAKEVIVSKNIKINKQNKKITWITLSLSIIILFLLGLVANLITSRKKEIICPEQTMNISVDLPNEYENNIILFSYKGGYAYQRLEVHQYKFTNETNLYLLRVHNTYVNGYAAYNNGHEEFSSKEYTEKVCMGIDFNEKNKIRTVASWHQKHSIHFNFSSQFVSNDNVVLEEEINLFDGATIKRNGDNILFNYNCPIADILFDYEYNTILRKANIENDYYYSSWEYQMLDEQSKKMTFTIYSSYLIEAAPNQNISFEVNTSMENTNMLIKQKKVFNLFL